MLHGIQQQYIKIKNVRYGHELTHRRSNTILTEHTWILLHCLDIPGFYGYIEWAWSTPCTNIYVYHRAMGGGDTESMYHLSSHLVGHKEDVCLFDCILLLLGFGFGERSVVSWMHVCGIGSMFGYRFEGRVYCDWFEGSDYQSMEATA